MRTRLSMLMVSSVFILSACGGGSGSDRAVPALPAVNDDGSITTQILRARFDLASGDPAAIPLPSNLLFSGTTDLTLELPVDPTNPAAPLFTAINSLDGWGTTTPWVAPFSAVRSSDIPIAININPDTVVAGDTVRWFEVFKASPSPADPVGGIVRELTPGVEFVATVSQTDELNASILLVPLTPLDELTTYMAVITRSVTDTRGNNATPEQAYFITQRTSPLVDENGSSTDPLLDDETAQGLEPVRQLVNAQEAALATVGIASEDIVVSFVATTQSITTVTQAAASLAAPQGSQLAPTGINTAVVGGAGVADIVVGVMNVPYYLEAPSASDPTATLTSFWEAEPGAYVPPVDQFGLDPTSTNITVYNPFPVQKSVQTIPVLVTVPNAGSGQVRPDAGWPVAIFQHGLTRNRTDMLAVADSLALAGFAVIAIDIPGHGVASVVDPATGEITGPEANPFYIENTPFGPIASERTFDVDLFNNITSAPGPDGFIDGSGQGAIPLALTNQRGQRDNLRQASVDLVALNASLPFMDFTGDGFPDFDASQVRFVGQSLGTLVGIPFTTVEPSVQNAVFNVPGAGIFGILVASPTFSPGFLAALASAGIEPGSALFNLFILGAQTVVESADPINWASATAFVNNGVFVQQVNGDTVIPNVIEGFPLAGGEALIREMGLPALTQTVQDPNGVKAAARFIVGDHGSLLSPAASPEATIEMQTQIASFFLSGGRAVQVTNPSVLQGN
ncbi:MAG: hypothetical protein AAGE01_17480 [Pseudomonadota bacterium]